MEREVEILKDKGFEILYHGVLYNEDFHMNPFILIFFKMKKNYFFIKRDSNTVELTRDNINHWIKKISKSEVKFWVKIKPEIKSILRKEKIKKLLK